MSTSSIWLMSWSPRRASTSTRAVSMAVMGDGQPVALRRNLTESRCAGAGHGGWWGDDVIHQAAFQQVDHIRASAAHLAHHTAGIIWLFR